MSETFAFVFSSVLLMEGDSVTKQTNIEQGDFKRGNGQNLRLKTGFTPKTKPKYKNRELHSGKYLTLSIYDLLSLKPT